MGRDDAACNTSTSESSWRDCVRSGSSASGETTYRACIPVHLRGTGESFAANIGGRLVGTSFAWLTATLAVTSDRANAPTKVALVAAGVGFAVYVVGLIASFWLPEPQPEHEEVARTKV